MPQAGRSSTSSEFDNFDRTMSDLLKVPHSEIKAALDAEKAEKNKKRKSKTSASDHASRAKD